MSNFKNQPNDSFNVILIAAELQAIKATFNIDQKKAFNKYLLVQKDDFVASNGNLLKIEEFSSRFDASLIEIREV